MFEWSSKLDTGIASIDDQHRQLVDLLGKLFKAMQVGAGSEVLTETLNGLEQYTLTHFAAEEQMMQHHEYPAHPDHSKEHELFRHKLKQLKDQYQENGQGALSIQIILFLRNWLTDHIGTTDQTFGQFLLTREQD